MLSKTSVHWQWVLACYDQWWCGVRPGDRSKVNTSPRAWAANTRHMEGDRYTGTDRPSIKTSSRLLWVTLPVTRVTCHKICEGKINRRGGNLTSNSILWLSLQFPVDLLLTRMAPGNKMIIKRVFISPHDRVYRIHEHLGKWGTHSHII